LQTLNSHQYLYKARLSNLLYSFFKVSKIIVWNLYVSRPGAKAAPASGAAPQRQWGPTQSADEAARANRMLPPLSVRNAMQAARRGGETSPSQSGAASASPSTSDRYIL
jgi:hypothetical protein